MLTDAEYATKMAIPDFTEKLDNSDILRSIGAECFSGDEYNGHLAWKRALSHARQRSRRIPTTVSPAYRVLKYCQDYYVLERTKLWELCDEYGMEITA